MNAPVFLDYVFLNERPAYRRLGGRSPLFPLPLQSSEINVSLFFAAIAKDKEDRRATGKEEWSGDRDAKGNACTPVMETQYVI